MATYIASSTDITEEHYKHELHAVIVSTVEWEISHETRFIKSIYT